jgi:cobalamin biosynthesis Mg chelatase CobN
MNSLKLLAVSPLPAPQQSTPEQQEKQQPTPSVPSTPSAPSSSTTTTSPTTTDETPTDTTQSTTKDTAPVKSNETSGNNPFLFGAIFVVVVAIAIIIYLKFGKKDK